MAAATRARSATTKSALFDAGIILLRERGFDAVSLAAVAEAAGVTRQAVYLHFGSRAGYLMSLVEHVNAREGIPEGVARALGQPTAEKALRAIVRLRATTAPRLSPLIAAINAAASGDADAAGLWRERQIVRLRPMLAIAQRFRDEKRLVPGLTVKDAANLLWSMLSFESWHYLVATGGWSKEKYIRVTYAAAMRALTR
ncbi:MAG: helix-turn-helix domain-containing protein [bacterium]